MCSISHTTLSFRSQRSCESQLISLTQELHEKLEEKSQVEMIVLDFSKAFDKVPHKRLMKKLWNYGVRGKTHSWIQSFLTTRQQRVAVDGENSDWVSVDSGVPQGTVLGPTLFLAFINDLVRAAKHSQVRLFADDCVLYREVKNQEDCELLQADLENLEKWEEKWSMSFNPDKCNSISITRKRNKLCHSYKLHNQDLKQVSSTPYLGVELSSDLTWHDQINKVCSKGNKTACLSETKTPNKQHESQGNCIYGARPPSNGILFNHLGSSSPQVHRPNRKITEKSCSFCLQQLLLQSIRYRYVK